jgi:hypothetical protein
MNNDAYFSVLSSCSVMQNVLKNVVHSVVFSNPLLSEYEFRPENRFFSRVYSYFMACFLHSLQISSGAVGLPLNNPGQFDSTHVSLIIRCFV